MDLIASFSNNSTVAYTKRVFQHNTGLRLVLNGITLPEEYEVHFSNNKEYDFALSVHVNNTNIVNIPDKLFVRGDYVYCWIVFRDSENDYVTTQCEVIIPVDPRPDYISFADGGEVVGATVDPTNHTLIFIRQ